VPVNAVTRSPWTPAVNPSFSQAPPMQRGEGEGAFIPEESRNTAISRHRLPDTPEINLWAKQHVGPGHRASAMGGMQVVIRPKSPIRRCALCLDRDALVMPLLLCAVGD